VPTDSRAGQGDTAEKRKLIRSLVAPADPADAMTAHYALWYDERRVELAVQRGPVGNPEGFVAVCQTGRDLFIPLVVLRSPPDRAGELLANTLRPGRTYLVVTLPELRSAVEDVMLLSYVQANAIYELDPGAYRPVVNVMVQPGDTPFRYEIRVQQRVVAAAGVNWRTDRFADMYVYTEPATRGRGWGRAVGSACVKELLSARLLPLYTVGETHSASHGLAASLGFTDSGARELECQGHLRRPAEAA
jgi:GNAT superfamily N-acetyltransferase